MSPIRRDDARSLADDQFEHERIGVHNEVQTVRRDRIRWGPVWAGIVTAVGSYLFLQLALVATGIVELGDSAGDDAILHGIVLWFASLVAIIVFFAIGSGIALGSFDTTDVFDEITLDDVDVDRANDDAQEAAGKALLTLTLGLAAAAAGGALGAKMWPKDDAFVDVVGRKDTQ